MVSISSTSWQSFQGMPGQWLISLHQWGCLILPGFDPKPHVRTMFSGSGLRRGLDFMARVSLGMQSSEFRVWGLGFRASG